MPSTDPFPLTRAALARHDEHLDRGPADGTDGTEWLAELRRLERAALEAFADDTATFNRREDAVRVGVHWLRELLQRVPA